MTSAGQLLLVGYGNMGRALVRGWLAQGRVPESIAVIDASAQACDDATKDGLTVVGRQSSPADADVAIIAVKPQQLADVLDEHAAILQSASVVLSIIAGKRISGLEDSLGAGTAIVRAMPNTPAAIGAGMSVLCANRGVSEPQRNMCEELMRAIGAVEWLADESLMDAVTAVSGSGPAYVFLLIESLASAGVQMGLEDELAMRLAVQTIAGSGAYAQISEVAAGELRRRVTSPGGTTEAALDVLLAEGGLPSLMAAAVRAATQRSRELSED